MGIKAGKERLDRDPAEQGFAAPELLPHLHRYLHMGMLQATERVVCSGAAEARKPKHYYGRWGRF